MKYYTLYPEDTQNADWLFFKDDRNDHLTIRSEYKDLACSLCGKLNEEAAIQKGIAGDFIIKSKLDWHGSFDDQIIVTKRFKDIVESENFQGLNFISIPNDSDRFLVLCTCLVSTNEEMAGFENNNLCSKCGRYEERLVGPLLQGMELPSSDLTFFASEIANENSKVSYRPIFASETIIKILKKWKIKGLDIVPAF